MGMGGANGLVKEAATPHSETGKDHNVLDHDFSVDSISRQPFPSDSPRPTPRVQCPLSSISSSKYACFVFSDFLCLGVEGWLRETSLFVAFSNLNDTEALTKTWKVCTKVASYLEQGQRLENLSWRLWHLQNLMVDTDNAKSKREFKKLSKCMGDKLDKEKGRYVAVSPPGVRTDAGIQEH
ncbi:hypothetical protein NP233_g11347 [Leucocoprinus birnbaumii]|uniref:Nitrogen regulatory protein areA GATA-like domain-containing protein n=1 Tax=Leucocoprinus birnbaumii TaxID=56174 RepID=A0AAD5VGY8_9AGAR|nr:hypothetical protein NP233_g11347 [Leucocoprinus birnbaumii]